MLPLVDSSFVDHLFDALPGPRIMHVPNPGWAGDRLIDLGFRREAECRGCIWLDASENRPDVVWHGGGFTMAGPWQQRASYEQVIAIAGSWQVPAWIVGQTSTEWHEWHDQFDRIFLRDYDSAIMSGWLERSKVSLIPDGAMLLNRFDAGEPPEELLIDFRDDREARGQQQASGEVCGCRTAGELLAVAGRYAEIRTNRLHLAIAGLLCGRRVILSAGSTHKQRSAWATWLADAGCEWSDGQ